MEAVVRQAKSERLRKRLRGDEKQKQEQAREREFKKMFTSAVLNVTVEMSA